MKLGEKRRSVLEFLASEKPCTLVSNEIEKGDIFDIIERGGVIVNNLESKLFEIASDITESIHYIKY